MQPLENGILLVHPLTQFKFCHQMLALMVLQCCYYDNSTDTGQTTNWNCYQILEKDIKWEL